MEQQGPAYLTTGQFAPRALGRRDQPEVVQNARHQAYNMRVQSMEQHNRVRLLVHMTYSFCTDMIPGLKRFGYASVDCVR